MNILQYLPITLGLLIAADGHAQPVAEIASNEQVGGQPVVWPVPPSGPTGGSLPVFVPNPAVGNSQLFLPDGFRADVFVTLNDMAGRVAKEFYLIDDGDGRSFIDLVGLPPGQYLVTLENGKGQRTTARLNVL